MKHKAFRVAAPVAASVLALALSGCVVPTPTPGNGSSATSGTSSPEVAEPQQSPTSAASADPTESTGAPTTDPAGSTAAPTESPAAPAESTSAPVAEPTESAAAPAGESADEVEVADDVGQDNDADNPAAFGQTLTRDDGLAVTVSQPTPFTPSEWAAGGEGSAAHVRFEITVGNGTGEPFDPSMIFTTASSGGVEGDQVFDDGIGDSPVTTLLPGKSVTFALGYGVEDPSDVLVQVEVDWDSEPALFGTESALS